LARISTVQHLPWCEHRLSLASFTQQRPSHPRMSGLGRFQHVEMDFLVATRLSRSAYC
jgi:hypothetical protein